MNRCEDHDKCVKDLWECIKKKLDAKWFMWFVALLITCLIAFMGHVSYSQSKMIDSHTKVVDTVVDVQIDIGKIQTTQEHILDKMK